MRFLTTKLKNYMIWYLAILIAAGIIREKEAFLILQVGIALVIAVLIEGIFYFIKEKKFFISSSAIITALIISGVMIEGAKSLFIIFAVLVALFSKYLIRWRARHIFNPANLGLLAVSLFFSVGFSWWAGETAWLVIILGLFIAFRMKNFYLVGSYIITTMLCFMAYSLAKNLSIFTYIGFFNFFFIFVMLVEPKTSPQSVSGRGIFGILTGILTFLFFLFLPGCDPSVAALAAGNIFVPFINSFKKAKI